MSITMFRRCGKKLCFQPWWSVIWEKEKKREALANEITEE
jgi:hypothetical protein